MWVNKEQWTNLNSKSPNITRISKSGLPQFLPIGVLAQDEQLMIIDPKNIILFH